MNEDRALIQMFQLSLSLGNCVVSWASAGALCKPSRTASASMSVISRSYPKNVLLSSSSLIRRRTSVPRVYNARRCLKRSTVDTLARRLYLLAPCARIVTYSLCTQLGTFRQSRCRGRRSRYDISCPRQPTHAACWFSHSKGINSSSKYGWQQTFPTGSPICTNFEFRSIAAKVWCRCLFCPSVLAVSPALSTLTVDCRSAALSAAFSVDLLAADAVIVLNPIQ